MKTTLHLPHPVSLSVRVYGLLLLAYPSDFRRAYGSAMTQVFADCCRAAGTGGLPGLWARTMLDYLRTVFEEHIQRGVSMSRMTFIKISGWALVSGPILTLLGWLASSRPAYSPYNAASWPIDRFLNPGAYIMFAFGLALISLGMFGLLARYGARSGRLAQAGLLLAGLSGLASVVGVVGLRVVDASPWWELFSIGLMLLLLGVAPFAIRCLQRGLMPRLNGLLLATTLWIPVVVSGFWLNIPVVLTGVMLALNLLGISLAGYQLQRAVQAPDPLLQTA